MALVRRNSSLGAWDPFREFQEFSERLNRAFAGNENGEGQQAARAFDWAPAVNISESDKAYLVKADLPEVKKEDVKITQEQGVLSIEGERRHEKRDDSEKLHRVESSYGHFLRRFTIPEDADVEHIEATFADGSLRVTIPKAEVKKPQPRQISVS